MEKIVEVKQFDLNLFMRYTFAFSLTKNTSSVDTAINLYNNYKESLDSLTSNQIKILVSEHIKQFEHKMKFETLQKWKQFIKEG